MGLMLKLQEEWYMVCVVQVGSETSSFLAWEIWEFKKAAVASPGKSIVWVELENVLVVSCDRMDGAPEDVTVCLSVFT